MRERDGRHTDTQTHKYLVALKESTALLRKRVGVGGAGCNGPGGVVCGV